MRFNTTDPSPGAQLFSISPVSVRLRSWVARVNAIGGISDELSVKIIGAVGIACGLDYHYEQFMKHVSQLREYYENLALRTEERVDQDSPRAHFPFSTSDDTQHLDALDHEAVAYFNRIGQLKYFARSIQGETRMPKAVSLMKFRHKHSAHRSIDQPHGESPEQLRMQAMTTGFYRLTVGGFPSYQIADGQNHVQFQMNVDHSIVMRETFALFQSVHYLPDGA